MNYQRKQLTERVYPKHPPYLIRTEDVFGRHWIRRATDNEIKKGKPHCILPVFFLCGKRLCRLSSLGIWKATETPKQYIHVTNSNGDIVGIGIC